MDLALWCYKGIGLDWMGWYPGGVRYKAPDGSTTNVLQKEEKMQNYHLSIHLHSTIALL